MTICVTACFVVLLFTPSSNMTGYHDAGLTGVIS